MIKIFRNKQTNNVTENKNTGTQALVQGSRPQLPKKENHVNNFCFNPLLTQRFDITLSS